MSSERLEKSESELNTLLRELQNGISSQIPSNYGGKVKEIHVRNKAHLLEVHFNVRR